LKTFVTSSGVVTSVGFSVPATSIFTATGSPVTGSGTLGFTTAGISGGIPYFSSAAALSSSAVLTANLPVIGGGAGVAPTVGTVSGTTTKFATVNVTTFATGQCVQVDASLNLTTTGSACGAGGGGTTIGTTTITGGTSGNFLYNNAGVYGERTPTQATAVLIPFSTTTTAQGVVPGSNGAAATSFLNATGAWSVPAGGGGAPGGSTLQVQYNNAGAFGGANVYVESANVLAQRNLANAQAYYVYNTTDAGIANYERGVMDWTTTLNMLTIGSQAAGTGVQRRLVLVGSSFVMDSSGSAGTQVFGVAAGGGQVQIFGSYALAWGAGSVTATGADTGFSRIAAGVVAVGNGTVGDKSGTLQTAALQATGTVPTGNTGTCTTGVTVAGGATAGTWISTAICAVAGTIILSAMPAMTTGYACFANDRTTAAVVFQQTASTTTSATLTVRSTATAANDVISYHCTGY